MGHVVQHVNRKVRIGELLPELCSPSGNKCTKSTLQLYKEVNG